MTIIESIGDRKTHDITIMGHITHDVCVAISALTNALVQYAEEYSAKNSEFNAEISRYERGEVRIHIEYGLALHFLYFGLGAAAIIAGFKLYEHNYPDEVKYVDAKQIKNSL